MKFTISNMLTSLAALVGAGALSVAGGCSNAPTSAEGDDLGAAESALTADQCDYFDVNGKIQICHAQGNGKFKMLRTNVQGCINGHSGHSTDFVTSTDPASPIYDPNCQGNGCLPEAAPCDATLPCCDGSTCTNGTCVADTPVCPCVFDATGFSPTGCFPGASGGWVMQSTPEVRVTPQGTGPLPECVGTDGSLHVLASDTYPVCLDAMLAFDAANWGLCTGSGRDLCTDVPSPLPPIPCAVPTCHADLGGFWDYQPLVPAGTNCNTAAGAAGTCSAGGTCVANAVNPCPCGGDPAWESVLNSGWACSQNGSNASVSNDGNTYGWTQTDVCGAISTDETQSVEIGGLTPAQLDACTAQLCHL